MYVIPDVMYCYLQAGSSVEKDVAVEVQYGPEVSVKEVQSYCVFLYSTIHHIEIYLYIYTYNYIVSTIYCST